MKFEDCRTCGLEDSAPIGGKCPQCEVKFDMSRNELKRLNIESDDEGILICFDNHSKGSPCEYERVDPKRLEKLLNRLISLI